MGVATVRASSLASLSLLSAIIILVLKLELASGSRSGGWQVQSSEAAASSSTVEEDGDSADYTANRLRHALLFREMHGKVLQGEGFIAELDQSDYSTPRAIRARAMPPSEDNFEDGTESTLNAVHKKHTRIIRSPFFDGDKVLGAILSEDSTIQTVDGRSMCQYLWEKKEIVPFLKIDRGLQEENGGIQLFKPIPNLDAELEKANEAGAYGTVTRSLIVELPPDSEGRHISALVTQQFMYARAILKAGLTPIIEAEISASMSPEDKSKCEELLNMALVRELDALVTGYLNKGYTIGNYLHHRGGVDPSDMATQNADVRYLVYNYLEFHDKINNRRSKQRQVILKITVPERPNQYEDCINHPNCIGVVAFSGGYTQEQACEKLQENAGMIPSVSRVLLEGLNCKMRVEEFNACLALSVHKIHDALCNKGVSEEKRANYYSCWYCIPR